MLTKEEVAWVRKMQKMLDQCPPRLGFYTTGDPYVTIFDREKEHLFDDNEDMVGEAHKYDAVIGELTFPSNVHGVCG